MNCKRRKISVVSHGKLSTYILLLVGHDRVAGKRRKKDNRSWIRYYYLRIDIYFLLFSSNTESIKLQAERLFKKNEIE